MGGGSGARWWRGSGPRDVATSVPPPIGRQFAFDTPAGAHRLDTLVAQHGGLSRTQAATLIATGRVTVAGRLEKASYRPRPGEHVTVDVPPPPGRDIVPESIPLRIAYEDPWLLIVDKSAGMVVHPAPGHWSGTLVNALMGRRGGPAGDGGDADGTGDAADAPAPPGEPDRAGLVHRLDKETSGLVLVAKTDEAHRLLTAALAHRRIRRLYAVMAWGHLPEDRLTVEQPIGRDPRDRKRMAVVNTGRSARTEFVRLARFDSVDLIRARLFTGRTHQIRVHLASVGHPVVGDDTYGGGSGRRLVGLPPHRHFLHAAWLTLKHPITGQLLDVRSPLPADLQASIAAVAGGQGIAGQQGTEREWNPTGDALDDVGFYRIDD